jgi:hypothetical protein
MSCATHRLDGGINVEMQIVAPDGSVIDTLRSE